MLTGLFLVASCAESNDEPETCTPDTALQPSSIVFQERDASLPIVPYREGTIRRQALAASPALSDYLGCAYRDNTSVMGDPENFTYSVVDLNRLRTDHPDYCSSRALLRNEAYSYAYTSDESFESKSTIKEKFSTGFELNLGFFKIGHKKRMERLFSTSYSEQSRDALGELTIEVQNALFTLMNTPVVNRRIAGEYLRPDFVEILYNSTIDELLDTYGTFVATGYYTGGRASAFYYGHEYQYSDAAMREEGLERDIEASFSWNKSSTSGSLSFGNNTGSSTAHRSAFQSVQVALKTIGGTKDTGVSIGAKNLNEVQIDMSKWLSSLDNTNNHTVIGIQDGGLSPLSDYLLEANFRNRIQGTHLGKVSTEALQIPYVVIENIEVSTLKAVRAVLHTRHNDLIFLGNCMHKQGLITEIYKGAIVPQEGILVPTSSEARQLAEQKSTYYQLDIRIQNTGLSHYNPYEKVNLGEVDESKMKKFVNTRNGMVYLFDAQKKVAFSFPDDDYTVDVYGIRDWVERMPTGTVSMTLLERDYTIVGL